MKCLFVGGSWAEKGFTEANWNQHIALPNDKNLASYWPIEATTIVCGGKGNLEILNKILELNVDPTLPIIWIWTEPGRDYGRITGKDEFDWMRSENIFAIRQELSEFILKEIKNKLPNPIGLIGGCTDVIIDLAENLNFTVLHDSWQRWIAETLGRTNYFTFGWCAADIGWRMDYNNVKPSKAAVFAWDDLVKEWCMWEDLGYFCHEHPTPLANEQFAKYLEPKLIKWLQNVKK